MPTYYPKTRKRCQDCPRWFLGGSPARWCKACRWKHRGRKPEKYPWTPEQDKLLRDRYDSRVKGRALEIATAIGWPKWVIIRRAARLGLCLPWPKDRRDWTGEEEGFLLRHAGSRHVHWMSAQLHRSESAVILKLKRLRISRRWREGYTLRNLEECFGIDHHGIDRWIEKGWLTGRRRGTRRTAGPGKRGPHDAWVFTDAAVLRFIREHPMEFELRKADQMWILDLLLNGPDDGRAEKGRPSLEVA